MSIVYAQESVATSMAVIRAGDPWDSQDPLVAAHPDLFGPEPPPHSVRRTTEARPAGVVESATRAPGERRGGHRG
jgi:hypothetical protein